MKTVICGTGSWATGLAQVLDDNGHEVILWGIAKDEIDDINENHRNTKYFESPINDTLKATDDLSCVKEADIVLLAVPTMAIESVLQQISEYIEKEIIIINVAKGFHPVTHDRLSDVIRQTIDPSKCKAVVSLIGPSHAEEVILRQLTVVNAVCVDEEYAKIVQELFSNAYFRVYRNTDEVGAEIGVALKNVMAIASGILAGLGQGDNARAALMTRGLAEITRYGVARGGKAMTFLGLDGVGDLIVTCSSHHSRNFMAGLEIGKANSAKEFMENNKRTVEGIFACKAVYEDAKERDVDMPITNEVYHVLYENKKPSDAIRDLMNRDLKREK